MSSSTVVTKRFRCPQCGGAQAFEPSSGRLRCDHCAAEESVSAEQAAVDDYQRGRRPLDEGRAADRHTLDSLDSTKDATDRAAVCRDCGAQVVFTDVELASRCTFCGSPAVTTDGAHRRPLRATSVLPFRIDKKHAERAFSRWLGRLWLRPSDLKSLATLHQLAGVYVPFWSFDAEVDSTWVTMLRPRVGCRRTSTVRMCGKGNARSLSGCAP